ncbi:hypothetical protein OIO90_005095 [Microbotryomycetes sp. JL221]|nr:hypothetical protein OIO90_005095 [Microbotryomycetes sp. JL221]
MSSKGPNDDGTASAPAARSSIEPTATTSATGQASRMKRNREAALGPTTPRSEADESKILGAIPSTGGASTPLAKKGRVGSDSLNDGADDTTEDHANAATAQAAATEATGPSSDDAQQADAASAIDATATTTRKAPATPPPGLDSSTVPDTPAAPVAEGNETRQIRRRVQALEWEDGIKPDAQGEDMDSETQEATQVADKVANSAQTLTDTDEKHAQVKSPDDVEAAKVAEEVAETAAVLGDKEEAKKEQDEKVAEVASEVAQSAAAIDANDEAVQATQPTAASSKSTSFSAFSSSSSPFSAVKAAASPFASVKSSTVAAQDDHQQKPKAKATFTASPLASVAAPSTPATARTAVASATAATSATPFTPFGKEPSSSSAAATSRDVSTPFSAFASKSGFAAAGTPVTATPKTGLSKGFGSFSAATASPFASVAASKKKEDSDSSVVADSGRKMGEAEEPDPSKKVFTEQEVVTGEENDELVHSVRAKLYAMHEGSWVERGTGLLKLNATHEGGKKAARLVMRADATHRLLLNAPLFPSFSIELFQEKYVRFAVIESAEAGPTSYMLRLGSPANATALVDAVKAKVETLA